MLNYKWHRCISPSQVQSNCKYQVHFFDDEFFTFFTFYKEEKREKKSTNASVLGVAMTYFPNVVVVVPVVLVPAKTTLVKDAL